jgi:ABC-type multidrug transport system ATPase subunit
LLLLFHFLALTCSKEPILCCRRLLCRLQEDNFVPTMTTKETLTFYSNMVIPSNWTAKRRQERVEEVLAAMGLAHSHHTLVGGTLPGGLMLRGLSGGERKRLAVAAGILAAPAVLFLDEPTSGLDSFAALTVMGYLQMMARATSQVVITTIHQPRSAIWQMFDTVTLLANGYLMYFGGTKGMVPWFGRLGYHYDPALHGVSSDWALDLVAVGFSKPARYYGETMTTKEQLLAASEAFTAQYMAGVHADEAEGGE